MVSYLCLRATILEARQKLSVRLSLSKRSREAASSILAVSSDCGFSYSSEDQAVSQQIAIEQQRGTCSNFDLAQVHYACQQIEYYVDRRLILCKCQQCIVDSAELIIERRLVVSGPPWRSTERELVESPNMGTLCGVAIWLLLGVILHHIKNVVVAIA